MGLCACPGDCPMCRRHVVLAVLTLMLIGLLTLQVVAPTRVTIPGSARAQEWLAGAPYPGAPLLLPPPPYSQPASEARDPASVASELLLTDSPPGVLPQPRP